MVRLDFRVENSKLSSGDNRVSMHTFYGDVWSFEDVLLVKKPFKNRIYKLWIELRHIVARYDC